MKPAVYIPQEPMRKNHLGEWITKGLDLAAATEYGELKIVWPPDASILTRKIIEDTAHRIADQYSEQTDYIVALGSPTLIAVIGWAIGNHGKRLRILEWSKQMKRYYPTLN